MDVTKMRSIILALAMVCVGTLLSPRYVHAVPICVDDDLCIEVPTEQDMNYEVRSGDFNGDGRTDLYVTGGYFRAVKDFIIVNNGFNPAPDYGFNFSIVASPSAAQQAAGKAAPLTSIAVYRIDLSSDGLNDFQLENVEEVIPNAPNLIILTSKTTGNQPVKIIQEDYKFLDLVEQVEAALQNIDAIMDIWNQIVCVPVMAYVQYSYQVWVPNNWFAPGGPGGYYQTYYAWVPVQLGNACWPVGTWYGGGPYKTFLDEMYQHKLTLPAGVTMLSTGSIDAIEARVARVIWWRKLAQAIRAGATAYRFYRNAALVVSVALVANDVTVVGVIDDPAAAAIAASAGGALVYEAVLNVAASHLEAKIREEQAIIDQATTVDPYVIKENCKPWDVTTRSTQDLAVIGRPEGTERPPKSAKLRANMNLSGCDCPSGKNLNAAHHIVRKNPGDPFNPTVADAIACLNRNGIDLDEAGNGVCLPTRDTRRTNAFKHGSGGMHGANYNAAVLKNCEDAELAGGSDPALRAQKVQEALDSMRTKLSMGQQFW